MCVFGNYTVYFRFRKLYCQDSFIIATGSGVKANLLSMAVVLTQRSRSGASSEEKYWLKNGFERLVQIVLLINKPTSFISSYLVSIEL